MELDAEAQELADALPDSEFAAYLQIRLHEFARDYVAYKQAIYDDLEELEEIAEQAEDDDEDLPRNFDDRLEDLAERIYTLEDNDARDDLLERLADLPGGDDYINPEGRSNRVAITFDDDKPWKSVITLREDATFVVYNIRQEGENRAIGTVAYHKYDGIGRINGADRESDDLLEADSYACEAGRGCGNDWSSGPLPIRIPEGDDYYYRATVFFEDGRQETAESRMFDLDDNYVVGTVPGGPRGTGLCDNRFSDVPGAHPYCAAIKATCDLGVMCGGTDARTGQRTYRADEVLTRAEFVAIGRRLAGISPVTCKNPNEWLALGYNDVAQYAQNSNTAWMCNELKSLRLASGEKIVGGYVLPNGQREIRLTNPVTSPEVVKIFLEALDFGRLLNAQLPAFNKNIPGQPWFTDYIRYMQANGLPILNLGPVTRGEVAYIIATGQRLYNARALQQRLATLGAMPY